MPDARISDDDLILNARGPKNLVDPYRPYASLVEREVSAVGRVEEVATIFLTNRECPFRCLFCDLWKNTTDGRVPVGAIPRQIELALAQFPAARHVKLYNSGNFFDRQAIPPEDYAAIAQQVARFRTVIVENHPRLCGPACIEFRDQLHAAAAILELATERPELEIALGLETVHPGILPRLNKQMTLDDFRRACEFLAGDGIALRAFILLKPPFMRDEECVEWALRALEFAFDCGVRVCSVIPTRGGNGIMERLEAAGDFAPPRLAALERALAEGLALARGRVFVDLWDAERCCECSRCGQLRIERLRYMNLMQQNLPAIECSCT